MVAADGSVMLQSPSGGSGSFPGGGNAGQNAADGVPGAVRWLLVSVTGPLASWHAGAAHNSGSVRRLLRLFVFRCRLTVSVSTRTNLDSHDLLHFQTA